MSAFCNYTPSLFLKTFFGYGLTLLHVPEVFTYAENAFYCVPIGYEDALALLMVTYAKDAVPLFWLVSQVLFVIPNF